MERVARETADLPAAMVALKRAAAPNGRQSAWARRHRTTAKSKGSDGDARRQGQADEGQERRPSSWWWLRAKSLRAKSLRARSLRARFGRVRFAWGAYGRRWTRVVALHFCKLLGQTRELFIRALDLFVGVREPFIRARNVGIVGFGFFRIRCGVHWRFPFRPMSSEGTGRPADGTPVLSKEWPYDGANGRMTEEHWIRWRGILQSGRPLPAAQRLCSSVPFLRADTMLRGTQYVPGIDRPAVRPSVASLGRRCGLGILGSSTSTFL